MFTLAFWKGALERAVRTFAQAAGATLAAKGLGLFDVDWLDIVSVGGMAALLAVLTALASAPSGGPGLTETPSDVIVAKVDDNGTTVAGPAAAETTGVALVKTPTKPDGSPYFTGP